MMLRCLDVTQHIDGNGRLTPATLEAIYLGARADSLTPDEGCPHGGRRFGLIGVIELR